MPTVLLCGAAGHPALREASPGGQAVRPRRASGANTRGAPGVCRRWRLPSDEREPGKSGRVLLYIEAGGAAALATRRGPGCARCGPSSRCRERHADS